MGSWFPSVYDTAMKPLEATRFKHIRKRLVHSAEGRVLEIGSGTGMNFPLYRDVISVDAIEPNSRMTQRAQDRLQQARVPIYLHEVGAEAIPFPDDTFDTVIATLVFCTIPDPETAFAEIHRVSKPGAKILFFEHIRMDSVLLGKTQDVLNPLWEKICDGCQLNRDTLQLIRRSGFLVNRVEGVYGKLFLTIEAENHT